MIQDSHNMLSVLIISPVLHSFLLFISYLCVLVQIPKIKFLEFCSQLELIQINSNYHFCRRNVNFTLLTQSVALKIRERHLLNLERSTCVPFDTCLLPKAFLNSQHSNRLTELNHILSTLPLISLCFTSMRRNVRILQQQAYSKYIIYQINKKKNPKH